MQSVWCVPFGGWLRFFQLKLRFELFLEKLFWGFFSPKRQPLKCRFFYGAGSVDEGLAFANNALRGMCCRGGGACDMHQRWRG